MTSLHSLVVAAERAHAEGNDRTAAYVLDMLAEQAQQQAAVWRYDAQRKEREMLEGNHGS